MLISKAKENLQNITKTKITYNDIAKVLGCSKQAISSRAHRNTELKEFEWEKLKEFYIDKQDKTQNSDLSNTNIYADYYSELDVSIKDGNYEFIGKKEFVSIPKKLISGYSANKKYFVINAIGDSMTPEIKDGDKLIIEFNNDKKIKDNRVYVFSHKDKIYVKRLVQNVNQLSVISDNTDKSIYPTQYINSVDIDNIVIIGKIAGLMRKVN